jgi:hypothetical protein
MALTAAFFVSHLILDMLVGQMEVPPFFLEGRLCPVWGPDPSRYGQAAVSSSDHRTDLFCRGLGSGLPAPPNDGGSPPFRINVVSGPKFVRFSNQANCIEWGEEEISLYESYIGSIP